MNPVMYGLILRIRPSFIPGTRCKSPRLRYGRFCTMRSANTGPIPGNLRKSFGLARLMSINSPSFTYCFGGSNSQCACLPHACAKLRMKTPKAATQSQPIHVSNVLRCCTLESIEHVNFRQLFHQFRCQSAFGSCLGLIR